MNKLLLPVIAVLLVTSSASAQRYFSRDGKVSFFSDTPMEKIEGVNKSATAVLDSKTGRMEWKVLIKNFLFEKALMQEHFNENYMESDKFSNATFKGNITDLSAVNFGKDGTYKVKAKGTMSIHGVDKEMEIPGTVTVSKGNVVLSSKFSVACADFDIKIPSVVRDNIAKEIAVTVDATLAPLNK